MKKIGIWFFLSAKRQCKHITFVVLLFALPVCMLFLQRLGKSEEDGISIALYAEGEWSKEIAADMAGQEGMFRFYLCTSKDMLVDDVSTGRAECGYVLPADLKERLDAADISDSIRLYTSPATVTAALSEELFFASMMESYGKELAGRWSSENLTTEEMNAQAVQEWVEERYASYMKDGGTYSFVYETVDSKSLEETASTVTYPVRGLIAVFLFVMGLSGGVTLCEDEQKGLYVSLTGAKKYACQAAALLAPLCLVGVSALAALWLTGTAQGIWKEVVALTGYIALIAAFSYTFSRILRKPEWLNILIPFFLIGSLVLTPVFFDISTWVPALSPFSKLFLPYYYLNLF